MAFALMSGAGARPTLTKVGFVYLICTIFILVGGFCVVRVCCTHVVTSSQWISSRVCSWTGCVLFVFAGAGGRQHVLNSLGKIGQ